ncbi:hypothetical protein SAMN05216232_0148 [Virgibacillus subterraneus]|uniref:DUF5316 domain-containing protein n=1 Tax=Virgibacillus subterraneus TaxID=621109 RepID=A0A1H9L541_9BACI|nr:hypothetical protein [Virgibacillus subterraneus]SER06592.1 hypothetical protein SAMN05216232_0148 [Virgibacillus subterraneus]
MKKVGFSLLSSIVIGLIIWAASVIISFSYSEWSFLIGLAISIVIYFFNSSGGALSKAATFEASESSWKIQKNDEMKIDVGAVFYGSLLYTIFSLVLMIIKYF